MAIGEILKEKDYDTYRQLIKMCKGQKKVKKEKEYVELGDTIQNLMKANSYKRINGALRQTRWE